MFEVFDVVMITTIVSVFAFYIGMRFAEMRLIAQMIETLSDDELKRLEELHVKLQNLEDDEDADAVITAAAKEVNLKVMKCDIVDGHHFYYDMDGNFVCQGVTRLEAVTNYELNNKSGMNGCVVSENGDKFYIVKGQIVDSLPA